MEVLRRTVKLMFGARYIFVTNTVGSGVLMGLGDWIIQHTTSKVENGKTDWARTGRMFTMGVCFGPLAHVWYKYLDRILPSAQASTVVRKVLLDQAIGGPVFISYFFFVTGFLEGHTIKQSWEELHSKFVTVYLVDLLIWPPAQSINFYFLPPQFRVVYIGGITLGYNAFLSFIKHQANFKSILPWINEEQSCQE